MTEFSRLVLDQFQVRKSRKQKTAFAEQVSAYAAEQGYACRMEKGSCGANNIVVGDPDKAKVVYTAHYDTCAIMPFPNFITPKNFWIYLLYQILLCVILFLPAVLLQVLSILLLPTLGVPDDIVYIVSRLLFAGLLITECVLMMAGPANRHTANDNTSGVITLLEIMAALPADDRDAVAFVFFDLEEMGLFGSAGFASHHKKTMKNTLLVNFDCVSDGAHLLFVLRRGARPYEAVLQKAFSGDEAHTTETATGGYIYPSDQANFPCGVGVCALKQTKKGLLYMDRIHTKNDTVFCEENIQCLTAGALRLVREIQN